MKTTKLSPKIVESASDLSERISQYIKPGTPPLKNVDEYYQQNRGDVKKESQRVTLRNSSLAVKPSMYTKLP